MINWINGFDAGNKKEKYYLEFRVGTFTVLELKWEKSKFMGVEIMGKTLGIIGCGNVGAVVADRAQGLKMRVISYDPYLSHERATELGIEKVELDELFSRSDFISLHTPLTDATRNIINFD